MNKSDTFSFTTIGHFVIWRSKPIIALIWLFSTSMERPKRSLSLSEKSPERNAAQFCHWRSLKVAPKYTVYTQLFADLRCIISKNDAYDCYVLIFIDVTQTPFSKLIFESECVVKPTSIITINFDINICKKKIK